MDLLALLLGIGCALLSGTSDFFQLRWSSKKIGPYATTVYQFSIATIALNAVVLIFGLQFVMTPFSVLLMTIASLINPSAFVSIHEALQLGPVSIVAPIIYSYPAITAKLGIAFLGVPVSLTDVLAFIAIVVGAMLVSTKVSELKNGGTRAFISLTPGVCAAIVASLLTGLLLFLLGAIIRLAGNFLPAIFFRGMGPSRASGWRQFSTSGQDSPDTRSRLSSWWSAFSGLLHLWHSTPVSA